MPEPMSYYYFDTVSLCNFVLANRLDLLIARYGSRVQVTSTVLDEIVDGIASGHIALQAIENALTGQIFSQVETRSEQEREIFKNLLRLLSPGEASCIAYAQNRGGAVVTDDKAARDVCREREIPCTGTIGILKACCRDDMITPSEADSILQRMINEGYFSPVINISGLL